MGKPAARMGDMTAHGGSIVKGEPRVLIGGMPAARLTDMHTCPMLNPGTPPPPHVGGPIMGPGAPTVLIGGLPAAVVGDNCTCAGPPATILPPGCPTVLIGTGGGGGGGAGGGGSSSTDADKGDTKGTDTGGGASGETETTTDEHPEHYLHVDLQDQGGNPVFGISYDIDTADGHHFESVAFGSIAHELEKSGDSTISLKTITRVKWSQENLKIGDKVQMQVSTAGFVSGTPATVDLMLRDINSGARVVKSFKTEVKDNQIRVDWEVEVPEDLIERQQEAYEQGVLVCPYYLFRVQVGGLTKRSRIAAVRDDITIALKGYEDNPLSDTEYELRASNGEIRTGKLDANGEAEEKDVAAGLTLVSFSKIPEQEASNG